MLTPGCALLSPRAGAADHLAYLTQALATDATGREALWRGANAADPSAEGQLRVALLQSLPNHSGHDPAAARERLAALANGGRAPADVAAVARHRLAEMGEMAECRREADELRQRLGRVVDIERRMNRTH